MELQKVQCLPTPKTSSRLLCYALTRPRRPSRSSAKPLRHQGVQGLGLRVEGLGFRVVRSRGVQDAGRSFGRDLALGFMIQGFPSLVP